MCGIIAVLSRPSTRPVPAASDLFDLLDRAIADPTMIGAARLTSACDQLLHGVPGVCALVGRHELLAAMNAKLDQLDARATEYEQWIESSTDLTVEQIEQANIEMIALRDATWAVRQDRLRTAREVDALAGRDAGRAAIAAYLSVQQALSALDRLEVRGRDSAGVHLFVWDHGLSVADPAVQSLLAQRTSDPLFQTGSVRVAGACLSFVYKAAKEIGELGDNTRALRAAIQADDLLRLALARPESRLTVLGHTRWASVGIISEPNCHPLNSEESEMSGNDQQRPYVVAALNGDVDNHADIKVQHGLRIPGPITTDAKVIPAVMSRLTVDTNGNLTEAFRRTVAGFEGSVAIGTASAAAPDKLFLALRGSGQALYIGLAEDTYIVASEPYGVVEETWNYLRVDGETPSPSGSRGQVFVLDASHAGELAGVQRLAYDGSDLPITADDVAVAQVTTRDIDRGDAPHFLLKEITEAPSSFRKTLRGKIAERDGMLHSVVGDGALPTDIAARLASGEITKVRVIGQGTAAVAGRSMAAVLDTLCEGHLDIDPITAT